MPGPSQLPAAVIRAPLCALFVTILCSSPAAVAQDESFLRCAEFSERDARIACLEQALEAAVAARAAEAAPVTASIPATQAPAPVAATSPPAPAPTTASGEASPAAKPGLLNDVFGWFGRDRNAGDANAPKIAESMEAVVANIDFHKPDVRTITLDNGQVWRQLYAERYNLRVGDRILITRATGRLQYRLEAERFNGFIRVERLR